MARQRDLPQPRHATITDLPTELLMKILREDDEFKTQRALRTLRLASRGLNAIVQDRVVEYIRIRGSKGKVEAMAASPSAFDRSAKILHLEGFAYPPGHQGWSTLAFLIKKMEALQEIQWVGGALNDIIVDAMGQLSLLRTIDFTFLCTSPPCGLRLPDAMLARLTSITLNFQYCLHENRLGFRDDETRDDLRYLISNTPQLEHLDIGPEDIASLVSIDEEFPIRTDSQPSLLSVAAKAVALLPTSTGSLSPFLSRLSTLEIPNHRSADWPVWPALQESGIELLHIKVDKATMELVNYLRGYQGLRTFRMGGPISDSVRATTYPRPDFIIHELLKIGLVKHRTTLTNLRFCAMGDLSYILPGWSGCTLAYMLAGQLPQFRRLERLDLVFAVGDRVPFGVQSHSAFVLNSLTTLSSNLKTVYLHVIGVGNSRLDLSSNPFRTLLQEINQFRFSSRPSNWESLQVVVRTFEPDFTIPSLPQFITRLAYRIAPSKEDRAKYCLEMDYAHTELLNERNETHGEAPAVADHVV